MAEEGMPLPVANNVVQIGRDGSYRFDYMDMFRRNNMKLPDVRDQGSRGNCHAFCAVGNIFTARQMCGLEVKEFSEQHLVDCGTRLRLKNGKESTRSNMYRMYEYCKETGICERDRHRQYTGTRDQLNECSCERDNPESLFKIKDYEEITCTNQGIVESLLKDGPLSITIDLYYANQFRNWNGDDVLFLRKNKRNRRECHSIMVTGCGRRRVGRRMLDHLILRNSHSTDWGNDGCADAYLPPADSLVFNPFYDPIRPLLDEPILQSIRDQMDIAYKVVMGIMFPEVEISRKRGGFEGLASTSSSVKRRVIERDESADGYQKGQQNQLQRPPQPMPLVTSVRPSQTSAAPEFPQGGGMVGPSFSSTNASSDWLGGGRSFLGMTGAGGINSAELTPSKPQLPVGLPSQTVAPSDSKAWVVSGNGPASGSAAFGNDFFSASPPPPKQEPSPSPSNLLALPSTILVTGGPQAPKKTNSLDSLTSFLRGPSSGPTQRPPTSLGPSQQVPSQQIPNQQVPIQVAPSFAASSVSTVTGMFEEKIILDSREKIEFYRDKIEEEVKIEADSDEERQRGTHLKSIEEIEKERRPTDEEIAKYKMQIEDSKGFDVGFYYRIHMFPNCVIRSVHSDSIGYDIEMYKHFVNIAAAKACEYLDNQEELEDMQLVKATQVALGRRLIYYITFIAKGSFDGVVRCYQAKVTRIYVYEPEFNLEDTVHFVWLKDECGHVAAEDIKQREGCGADSLRHLYMEVFCPIKPLSRDELKVQRSKYKKLMKLAVKACNDLGGQMLKDLEVEEAYQQIFGLTTHHYISFKGYLDGECRFYQAKATTTWPEYLSEELEALSEDPDFLPKDPDYTVELVSRKDPSVKLKDDHVQVIEERIKHRKQNEATKCFDVERTTDMKIPGVITPVGPETLKGEDYKHFMGLIIAAAKASKVCGGQEDLHIEKANQQSFGCFTHHYITFSANGSLDGGKCSRHYYQAKVTRHSDSDSECECYDKPEFKDKVEFVWLKE